MITAITSPEYADASGKSIRCTVALEGKVGTTSYVAVDGDAVSQATFNDLISGRYGGVAPYVPPDASTALSSLVAATRAAVAQYAIGVVAQVVPDLARATALQSAASMVAANGGSAPTTGPAASAFAMLAASYESSVDGFAALVVASQVASMTVTAAAMKFTSDTAAVTSAAQLSDALVKFQSTMNSVVDGVNAVFKFPIVPPPAVSIPGVNA